MAQVRHVVAGTRLLLKVLSETTWLKDSLLRCPTLVLHSSLFFYRNESAATHLCLQTHETSWDLLPDMNSSGALRGSATFLLHVMHSIADWGGIHLGAVGHILILSTAIYSGRSL